MIWASIITMIDELKALREPLSDGSGRGRLAEFYELIDRSAPIPEEESEMGTMGGLLVVAVAFLVGKERKSYQAVKPLAKGRGINLFRRSKMEPVPPELRETRTKTVSALLALVVYFAEEVENDYMAGLLMLLSSFAVDSCMEAMCRRILPVIADAARDRETWELVQEVIPELAHFVGQMLSGVPYEELRPPE